MNIRPAKGSFMDDPIPPIRHIQNIKIIQKSVLGSFWYCFEVRVFSDRKLLE